MGQKSCLHLGWKEKVLSSECLPLNSAEKAAPKTPSAPKHPDRCSLPCQMTISSAQTVLLHYFSQLYK